MIFGGSAADNALRDQVHDVLSKPAVRDALAAIKDSGEGEPDVRPLYRELGQHGLLAVSWPKEYGGRAASHSQAAAVIEELVRAGVPDTPHVLSVQIVGLFLLQAGSTEQKARYLPALAAGECFACVLYTEPEVGSDLASLRTSAVRDGDGYRLSGVKVFGLKSGMSDLGLCAARTGQGATKYEGISLFLVDLHSEGVRCSTIPSVADERFHRVELNDVWVGVDALLGALGEGWALLTRCLAMERTGLDYSLKAECWFTAALAGIEPDSADDALLEQIGRHGAAVTAGRLLAWDVISGLDRGLLDPAAAAMAKYHTSETAQEVAIWAALVHGYGYGLRELSTTDVTVLEAGYREAPGLTLSAGTSQIMLELVASSGLHRTGGLSGESAMDLSPDPVMERIDRTVRARLAALCASRDGTGAAGLAALCDIDALAYEALVDAGGYELGLSCGIVVCIALGRQALPDVYTDCLLVVDALAAGADRSALTAQVMAGQLPVVAGGLDVVCAGDRERLAARRVAGGWELSGTVMVDDLGLRPAACCVPLVTGDEVILALLPCDRWRPRVTGSVARFRTLTLDGLIVGDADILGRLGGGSPLSDPEGLLARTRLRHAAYLLGLGEGAHELAVRYAGVRRQFGRPILDNQAIAFPLAQNEIALSAARLSLHQASWLADAGAAFALEAAETLALSAEMALRSIRVAVQVHGARGMTLDSPIHAFHQVLRGAMTRLGSASPLWREAGARRLATLRAAGQPER